MGTEARKAQPTTAEQFPQKSDMVPMKINLNGIPFDIDIDSNLIMYFKPTPIVDLDRFVRQFDLPIGDESNLMDAIGLLVQKTQALSILRERLG